jgi:hypothetical protein
MQAAKKKIRDMVIPWRILQWGNVSILTKDIDTKEEDL